MPVLLDTHAFLWWCEDSPELSTKARKAIAAEDCFVSSASFWEIAIKVNLDKLGLPGTPEKYLSDPMLQNGFEPLGISFRDTVRCASMERHRGDAFDRMLVAQARERSFAIVSRDPCFNSYGIRRIW